VLSWYPSTVLAEKIKDKNQTRSALQILKELAACPSAPLYENIPARYIRRKIQSLGLDCRYDHYGNLIVRYKNLPRKKKKGHCPIAFVSHMDHPGFELIPSTGKNLLARSLGGVPLASMKKKTPVFVFTPDGERLPGTIHPIKNSYLSKKHGKIVKVILKSSPSSIKPPLPLTFDLPDFSQDGDTIRMRSADDLGGCAIILAALERMIQQKIRTDLFAVFTRAEEIGLYGACLMGQSSILPKNTQIVSIECSSLVPGVSMGDGPIIRTGDRASTFDFEAEQTLSRAVDRIKKSRPGFRCQRHLMSAGVCEATAFAAFGYKVTGLALPLGNWHNATTNLYDPNGRVDSEFISESDYLSSIDLLTEAAKNPMVWNQFDKLKRLRQIPSQVRRRMTRKFES